VGNLVLSVACFASALFALDIALFRAVGRAARLAPSCEAAVLRDATRRASSGPSSDRHEAAGTPAD
jgi:hypothetical protein